jgi:hypothetical protein
MPRAAKPDTMAPMNARESRTFAAALGLCVGPALALGLAAGCIGSVDVADAPRFEDGGGADAKADGTSDGSGGGGAHDGGKDALPDYVDPGCPDAGPPMKSFDCDPYNQNNGDCAPGEACYIYVQYPSEPCGQETYGAVCQPQGIGGQGDTCFGAVDCQAGFVCVVSGSGNQCVQLCELQGDDGCPAGLVCEPIDVEGFGGCL